MLNDCPLDWSLIALLQPNAKVLSDLFGINSIWTTNCGMYLQNRIYYSCDFYGLKIVWKTFLYTSSIILV